MKISQSLLKGLLDYKQGNECGLLFKEKYLSGRYDLFPPSDAQNLGAWFEYLATGSLPKNNAIPQAKYMKRKKKSDGTPELATEYRLMQRQVENFHQTMDYYGLEVLKAGEDIKVLYPNSVENYGFEVWLTGTLDIRVRATRDITTVDQNRFKAPVLKKGEIAIVDLKSTGLLEDSFNKFGWSLDRLGDKVSLITQPIHYKYIEYLKTGIEPPFIFMLFSTKDGNDVRIIDFKLDDSAFLEHEAFINEGIRNLMYYEKKGFKPLPSLSKCATCPLRETCEYRAVVAPITVFYYGHQP